MVAIICSVVQRLELQSVLKEKATDKGIYKAKQPYVCLGHQNLNEKEEIKLTRVRQAIFKMKVTVCDFLLLYTKKDQTNTLHVTSP